MNWFTIAGAILHLLKNVPDIVDDVEDIYDRLTGKEEPPAEVGQAVQLAIANARQP